MSIRHTVKAVVEGMPHIVMGGVPPVRAGDERLASRSLEVAGLPVLTLLSDDFAPDGPIPRACAAEGENQAPVLRWLDVPAQTKSLVLMAEDPDAPTPEPFVHWLVWGIAPGRRSLQRAPASVVEGRNSMMKKGWTGCAPPKGDVAHRYVFELFALEVPLHLSAGKGRTALVNAMAGHVVGYGELRGSYQIPK